MSTIPGALKKLEAMPLKILLVAAFAAGTASSFAMPPYGFFPLLFLGVSFLYVLTALSVSLLNSFLFGWFFGFGYFVAGLYWIGNALLIEGNPYIWAWPLAVCGLPFVLAFFCGFATLLARKFSDLTTLFGYLAFCAWFAFFEMARSFAFTGFPWNLFGHTWADVLPVLQILSVSDVYWLNLLTILICALPGYLLASKDASERKRTVSMVVVFAFVAIYSYGSLRLHNPKTIDTGTSVRIVQANIPQSEKWDTKLMWDHFIKHLDLSRPDGSENWPVYVVWAETALSQWILEDPRSMALIRDMLGAYPQNSYLITGFLEHDRAKDRYYNSMIVIDNKGNIIGRYRKNHLVPFGEYIPFQEWIPLEPVAKFKGFSGGGGAVALAMPEGLKFSPAICYEIIFSGNVADAKDSPDFIVNLTNDSWYGRSPGPYQHFSQAVFRAIEEGRPVVRVAETGLSAVIDPYGRVHATSGLYDEYEKNIALPGSNMVSRPDPIYRRVGLLALLLTLIAVGHINKRIRM